MNKDTLIQILVIDVYNNSIEKVNSTHIILRIEFNLSKVYYFLGYSVYYLGVRIL